MDGRHHLVTTDLRRYGGQAVVAVTGDLDVAAVPDVEGAIVALEEAGAHSLVLDLREVVHLDSSGLRVLLDAASRARGRGERLMVVAPARGPVGRILELTLLADHLDVVDDLAAALR